MPDKAPREWMAFYVLHYLGDTSDLTFEQHGAYSVMLWTAWTRGGTLPGDDDGCRRALAAYTKDCTTKRFNTLVKPLLERFFHRAENGSWRNLGLEKERSKARNISDAGREAAMIRWENNRKNNLRNHADALPSQSGPNAKQTDTINNNPFTTHRAGARVAIPSYADVPLSVPATPRAKHSRGGQ